MKKVVKLSLSLLLIVMLVFTLSACSKEEPAVKETVKDTPVTIRFSHGLPENHYIEKQFKVFANAATKANSTLKIEMYPSAQLYKETDAIEAVQTGALEAAAAYSFNIDRVTPETRVFNAPFLFDSTETLAAVSQSSVRQQIDTELSKKKIKVLAYIPFCIEDMCLVLSKPVRVPKDVKGMVCRAVGSEFATLAKSWGMKPSFISGSELYMALQRGVLDSSVASVTTSIERKLHEVAPYATVMPIGAVMTMVLMNKDFFDKLSAGQQQALINAGKEVEAQTLAAAKANLTDVWKRAEAAKIKVYSPTPDEMKLWTGDLDSLYKESFKDAPQVLNEIKVIQQLKAK